MVLKRTSTIVFIFVTLMFLSACGGKAEGDSDEKSDKVTKGMNELSVEELEKKLENKDTFYFVGFSSDANDANDVELVEGFDKVAEKDGKAVFYTNFIDSDENKVKELKNLYEAIDYIGESWEPYENSLTLIENGMAKLGTIRQVNVTDQRIDELKEKEKSYMDEKYQDDIKDSFNLLNEHIQTNNVTLTFDK